MITIARINGVLLHEVGSGVFDDLVSIYPEGRDRHAFWSFLPVDDDRTAAIMDLLAQAGWHPWGDHSRPKDRSREYTLLLERQYDDADLACEYLELSPRTKDWGPYRDEATGLVKLDVHQLDNSADFGAAYTGRYVVPQRVKRLLETANLRRVVFRPALLADSEQRESGSEKIIPWETWGPPWWEITSDYTLPPVSPSMDLRDNNGNRVEPGDPRRYYHRREGLYLWPELHYRSSDLANAPAFDLARTLERFGGELRWDESMLVASRRFYQFCVDHGLKTDWVPVRIDSDRSAAK